MVTAVRAPSRKPVDLPSKSVILVIVGHLVLVPLVSASAAVATLYGLVALLLSIAVALRARNFVWVAAAAAYVAASDVLWRTTEAKLFYEGPKFFAAGILCIGIVRFVGVPRGAAVPAIYLALLLPSCLVTLQAVGLGDAREPISFSLSGPLLLSVSVVAFRQMKADTFDLRLVLVAFLAPLILLAGVVLLRLIETGATFGNESTAEASGGFGPNQVSTVLGLGALVCLLLVLVETKASLRLLFASLGFWLLGQGALTLSRGGVYGFAISAIIALLIWLSQTRRLGSIGLVAGLVVVGVLLFPVVDSFTSGALSNRLQDTEPTGRDELIASDIDIFEEHVLVGVGPSGVQRVRGAIAHTEFTRLPAEHGLLGVVSLALLLQMAWVAVKSQRNVFGRVFATSLVLYALLAMTNAAMRTASIGFVFGLGALRLADTAVHGETIKATDQRS